MSIFSVISCNINRKITFVEIGVDLVDVFVELLALDFGHLELREVVHIHTEWARTDTFNLRYKYMIW